MDALLQSVSQTVAHDVLELMHATHPRVPELEERLPPNWHWGIPLGFASLAAAGALLVAAAGLHQRMLHEQRHHGAPSSKTRMHKHRPRPGSAAARLARS
jgi:hypothetical protein